MKQCIHVSAEMLAFVGDGAVGCADWPELPVVLTVCSADATVTIDRNAQNDGDLILVVASAACERIFGFVPPADGACWHASSAIRSITLSLIECPLPEPARTTLRLAKSIELLCGVVEALREGSLVPSDGTGQLSELDTQRIVAARRMIDERWRQKLTLDDIARACGLNRTKLTRGFRSMFACTVNDAIVERRLGGARQMLLASDLPISSIGYRCGYLNNASFTRAFTRRFGEAPSHLRAHRVAA